MELLPIMEFPGIDNGTNDKVRMEPQLPVLNQTSNSNTKQLTIPITPCSQRSRRTCPSTWRTPKYRPKRSFINQSFSKGTLSNGKTNTVV